MIKNKLATVLVQKFYSKLTFQSHIDNICKKASQKLKAVCRIIPYMDFNKRRLAEIFFRWPSLTTAN